MSGLIEETGGLGDAGVYVPYVQLSALTYAKLPASPVAGMFAYVSDATVTTGSVTQGGGSNKVLVWYNGSAWNTVMN